MHAAASFFRRVKFLALVGLGAAACLCIQSQAQSQVRAPSQTQGQGTSKPQAANRLQLAGRYAADGQTEKALALYEELYKEDPQTFVYQGYLGCLQSLSLYDKAEKLIRKQMKASPLPVLVKVDLAQNYLLQNQKNKAEEVLQEIVKKTDFSQPGLSVEELAEDMVKKTRMYAPAIEVYKQGRLALRGASDLAGETAPAYASALANLYRLEGRYAEMLDEYVAWMQAESGHEEEVYARLQALMAGDGGRGAAKVAREILTLAAKKAQAAPDDPVVQDLFVWTLLQNKQYEAAVNQARSYVLRFGDQGRKWYQVITLLASGGEYDLAQEQYEDFIEQGSRQGGLNHALVRDSRMDLLNLYFRKVENGTTRDSLQINHIKREYKRLLAELGGEARPEMYRNLAHIYAYYTSRPDSARIVLQQALASRVFSPHQKARLKTDLADILLYDNKVWDATLLYSQVEKDFKQDAEGFYAKLQNARLSYYIGEFEWAESQLDVLRAATSKLIANDAMELSLMIKENRNPDSTYEGLAKVAKADLLYLRRLYLPAMALLDEVLEMPMEGALFDDVHMRKAQIYLKMDSVEEALRELERIYTDYGDDLLADDALFMAGGLLQLRSGEPIDPGTEFLKPADFPPLGAPVWGERGRAQKMLDRGEAMRLYQRIFTDFPASALAPLARLRYRQLREKDMLY